MLFPSLIHVFKRNPATNLKDKNALWDFLSLRPESMHQVAFMYSDRGIPDGFRHMNGYGSHTFKLVNKDNEALYCKFHYKTDQGIRNLSVEAAEHITAEDPDYAVRDLYNAIANGNFPSWTLYIQVMTFEQARRWVFNPFDLTKVWPQRDFPLIEVGKIVLNKNPNNFFADVEQLAFSPSFFVPGIEPSPDKVLQARLTAYADTHRYRLGVNFLQIPVNASNRTKVRNYERDGLMSVDGNQDGAPNYYPNSFGGPVEDPLVREPSIKVSGDVDRWNSADEDNVTQVRQFYRNVLNNEQRERLACNIASDLAKVAVFIQERAINNFAQADQEFGNRIRAELGRIKNQNVLL